jgi:hypothetical protein
VLTPRFERPLSKVGTVTVMDQGTQRALNSLISLELTQRVTALEEASKAHETQIRRWSAYGHFVVPDTSEDSTAFALLGEAFPELAPVLEQLRQDHRLVADILGQLSQLLTTLTAENSGRVKRARRPDGDPRIPLPVGGRKARRGPGRARYPASG